MSSRRFAVLHMINTGGPGGAETVCVNLVHNLDRERWRSVVALPDAGWMSEQLDDGSTAVVMVGLDHPAHMLTYLFRLARIIRKYDVRIMHAHLFGPSLSASLLGVLTGVPVICTLHGPTDIGPDERYPRLKFGLINRGASRVVFVSQSLREFFIGRGVLRQEKTAVIPNGVDIDSFAKRADRSLRSDFGALANEFLVGAVGNVRPAKGYDVLLNAAAILNRKHDDYRFCIVGQSDSDLALELMEKRDDLGLSERVRFAGFRNDIGLALNAFDAYVISSRDEGFSLSTVEALASGLPVVATRCGGPEEIIEHDVTGLLVENGSAEAIADAIERLRRDPELRRRLTTAAKVAMTERFGLSDQVDAYERLYEECLVKQPPGRSNHADRTAGDTAEVVVS